MPQGVTILGWDGHHEHPIRIDHETGSLVTVTHASMEAHEGHAFSCMMSVDDIADETNDIVQLTWTTPDTDDYYIHMTKDAKCSATALYKFTEGWTTGGTAVGTLAVFNRNRNSFRASSMVISYGVTAVGSGTVLKEEYVATGKFGSGETRDSNEWILKRNTTYAVSLYLDGAATATIQLHWYEHY